MNLSGNTILITGATSGIGRSLAETLHNVIYRKLVHRTVASRLVAITRIGGAWG